MESFSMLPVRTSSGRVVRERYYQDLLDKGVRPKDALNMVLGKGSRRWSDRMSYMSPSIYRGPSQRDEGIMKELLEPSIRHPKIKSRVIYLTGQPKSTRFVSNAPEIVVNDPIDFLKHQNNTDIIKNKIDDFFDLDTIEEEIGNIDFVPSK